MTYRRDIFFGVLATTLLFFGSAARASGPCGKYRWDIKTASDPDISQVNFHNVQDVTIAEMSSWPVPKGRRKTRIQPQETTLFGVEARVVMVTLEEDRDLHIVIRDGENTMIAEVPDPDCVSPDSPIFEQLRQARADIEQALNLTNKVSALRDHPRTYDLPARIEGIGFFDEIHGQTGGAPNGIELHPVWKIDFETQPAPN